MLSWYRSSVTSTTRRYHHGSLRAALVDAALAAIERDGPANVSLRALAREVGVSSAAPVHHFGDKAGLLTAIATEGFRTLAASMTEAWRSERTMLAVGVSYVEFAVTHPAHFAVMFRSDLLHSQDPDLLEARRATEAVHREAAAVVSRATGQEAQLVGLAGWSLMHGVTALWADGLLPPARAEDPVALARELGTFLFQGAAAERA